MKVPRRSFVARFGAVIGAGVPIAAQAQSSGITSKLREDYGWQPARHELDDWMDRPSAKHRFIFDTTTPAGFGAAILFANNYFIANQNGYGLQNSDLAVIIVARHTSTAFAYSDVIWSKYGSAIAQQVGFNDPKSKQAPTTNLYNASGYGTALDNFGVTLDSVLKRGVQLAVCQMASRALAGVIARAAGAQTEAIYTEMTANVLSNSHMVPAGIVAVNRAQERGYSFVHA